MRHLSVVSVLLTAFCTQAISSAQSHEAVMFRGGGARTAVYDGAPVRHLALAWRVHTGGPVRSSPAVHSGVAYVGSSDGSVYALDAFTGRQCWATALGSSVVSSPAVSDHSVFLVDRENTVVALDRATGQIQWRSRTGTDAAPPWGAEHWDFLASSPAFADNRVLIGSGDGNLYALDADSGSRAWTFKADGRIRSSPAVAEGIVVFGTVRGSVYALSVVDGTERWVFQTAGYTIDSRQAGFDRQSVLATPALDKEIAFIGSRDANFYALSLATGRELWRTQYAPSWVFASAAAARDVVYVATSDAMSVQALDARTGAERWKFNTGARVLSSPIVVGGSVQFGTEAGDVVSLDAGSGVQQWRYRTDGPVISSPAAADGFLFVGSDDGSVYAFRNAAHEIRRAVFWESAKRDRSYVPATAQRLGDYFAAAGYEVLDSATLAAFLIARITDRRPSVVVFAIDDIPDDVSGAGGKATPLLRRYLDAGGSAVWTGVIPPGLVRRNADGRPIAVDAGAPERLLGMRLDTGNGDWYGVRLTDGGRSAGLSTWWVGRGEALPENVSVTLAVDEFGRAAAWSKSFGGPPGTGFVRLWGSAQAIADVHIRELRTAVELIASAGSR